MHFIIKNAFPIGELRNTPLALLDPKLPISTRKNMKRAAQIAIKIMLKKPL